MKFLIDFFPALLFFVALKFGDIFLATKVIIAASLVQVAYAWIKHRHVSPMLLASLALIVVFGGLTLFLRNEIFVKWKPTVLYWCVALALAGSMLFFKKNLIQSMFQNLLNAQKEASIQMPASVWAKLNYAWIGFFFFMGVLNLLIAFAFDFSVETWAAFKVFGSTGCMLVFLLGQMLLLSKYIEEKKHD